MILSCLGGANAFADPPPITIDVGVVDGAPAFQNSDNDHQLKFDVLPDSFLQSPLRVGNDFSPNNFARPMAAARFEALDLATPASVRSMPGELLSAEVSFAAAGERTGLGLDLSITPRAQIQQNRAGNNIARAGAEVRVGPNLVDRDLRGKTFRAPSWYFFVGADNEALMWNLADKQSVNGLALRDQATVGDLQAGVALSTGEAGQMSFGMVERKLTFTDIAGDHDIDTRERFAAFSYTLHN